MAHKVRRFPDWLRVTAIAISFLLFWAVLLSLGWVLVGLVVKPT